MATGRETIEVPRSKAEAMMTRDAIAKLVYANLFTHTVRLINEAIDGSQVPTAILAFGAQQQQLKPKYPGGP